jgi:hypothetical protein
LRMRAGVGLSAELAALVWQIAGAWVSGARCVGLGVAYFGYGRPVSRPDILAQFAWGITNILAGAPA